MRDEQIINAVVEYCTNARITAERLMGEEPESEEYYAGKADAYMNVQALILDCVRGESDEGSCSV